MTAEEIKTLLELMKIDPVAACLLYEEEIIEALELLLDLLPSEDIKDV